MVRHKGASGSHTITCPQCDKEIDCDYRITPYRPEQGEWGFSLGQPEELPEVEWNCQYECADCGQDLTATLAEAEEAVFKYHED